jgi:hypothetical protein
MGNEIFCPKVIGSSEMNVDCKVDDGIATNVKRKTKRSAFNFLERLAGYISGSSFGRLSNKPRLMR